VNLLAGLGCHAEDRSEVHFPADGVPKERFSPQTFSDVTPQEIPPCQGNMEFCEATPDYPLHHVPQVSLLYLT